MNIKIKDNIEEFFTKQPVIIESNNEKTWNEDGLSITLKTDNMKFFVLLLSKKQKYDWFIHFENESDEPYTDKEKEILFNAVKEIVQPGEIITTEGGVTPGGIHALHQLENYGFTEVGTHKGNMVGWCDARLMDFEKFDRWLSHADPKDYTVINKNQPLSISNTKPVVLILQRNEKTKEEEGSTIF